MATPDENSIPDALAVRHDGSMDQGVAAVVAGLAGTMGALAGAMAGVRGARLGALKAVEAARLQVEDQAQAEHRHWVREQRRQAYTRTSHLYVEVLHNLRACADALSQGQRDLAAERQALTNRAVIDLQIAVFDLRLWGPPEIVAVAKDLRRSANRAFDVLVRWRDAVASDQDCEHLLREYNQAVDVLGDPYAEYMRVAADTLGVPSPT
ncbi:hypothetical protein [Streptomyces sp. NRRL S-31]|uniref:hypothetical protein n=1 Tax=Streptomyces sp. NRRL S-31 TaxID=1463898 RepID=UPI00131DF31A|nr:hypothetical protein [Streptomyces sp. NRRL S-31]